jgi:hypothetical protein
MFTQGEMATLRIVGDEVRAHGVCVLSYDEIAARSGCCRTLARRAIRIAARLGLLSIEVRPRPGQKNLTNVLRIRSPEWRVWLRMDRGHGRTPHGYQDIKSSGIKGAAASKDATLSGNGRAGERGGMRFAQSRRE